MDIVKFDYSEDYLKSDIPAFNVGDTVKVHIKIKEGNRERIQVFEGFVLKKQNGGISETFTVRKISSGVGVEKTFPLHSPKIEKIEVVRKGDVRRAKLNYMREQNRQSRKDQNKGRLVLNGESGRIPFLHYGYKIHSRQCQECSS